MARSFVGALIWIAMGSALCVGQDARKSDHTKPSATETQATAAKQKTDHPWLDRARAISAEIENDLPQLQPNDAVLVQGRLAQMCWKADPVRAKAWLDAAVAAVTRDVQNESPEDNQKRMQAGFQLVRFMTPLDSAKAKEITEALNKSAADKNSEMRAKQQANIAFRQVVSDALRHGNPQMAADLLSKNIKDGHGFSINSMRELRSQSPQLADRIFRETLQSAAKDHNWMTIAALMEDAFPPVSLEDTFLPPAELKQSLLKLYAESLLRVPENDDAKRDICNGSMRMDRVLAYYPAEQAAALQAVYDKCNPRQRRAPPDVNCDKVGSAECSRMADAEQNPRQRLFLRTNALLAAGQTEHDLDQAVNIYKRFTKEELEQDPSIQMSMGQFYDEAAMQALNSNDHASIYGMLRDIDDRLRAQVTLFFAQDLLEKGKTPESLALLAQARDAFAHSGGEDGTLRLNLLSLYGRYRPEDLPEVLRETADGLNQSATRSRSLSKELQHIDSFARWGLDMTPIGSTAALLDLDASFVSSTIGSVESVQVRECWRLGLVHAALKRDAEETAKKSGAQKAK